MERRVVYESMKADRNFEVIPFGTPEDLAQAAARAWLKELSRARGQDGAYCVALSGGRIAGTFFAAAAELMKRERGVLEPVSFFWADERCVSPADPESNFRLAKERLFGPLRIPESQIHRVRGEERPEIAAARAEAELRQVVSASAESQPVLDLIFLGVGEEGHVASLFPGEPEGLMASAAVYRPVVAPKPPPRRITLGYPAIAAARQVWVLASGPGKATALEASLKPEGRTPLARVLQSRPQTRIFTDIPAGNKA